MKRIISLIVICLLVSFTSAYAGSGRGYGPGWQSTTTSSCSDYIVTNITSHPLIVTFTPTKVDGTVVSNSYVRLTYDTVLNAQISEIELAPGKSCYFSIKSPNTSNGFPDHGVLIIDWKNKNDNENDYKGLIAHGARFAQPTVTWTYSLVVNGGMPF